MADHIDAIMASILSPLVQAFSGTLTDSQRDVLRANALCSRVKIIHHIVSKTVAAIHSVFLVIVLVIPV